MNYLKSFINSVMISGLIVFAVNAQDSPDANGYVGVDACGMCHKTEKQGKQLDIWKSSKHAEAFKTLQTDTANAIATKLGFTTPAAETEECLKCHAVGYNLDASLLGKKFSMADGVQCETCHGAGSNYKSLKIMKDKAEAIKNGLVIYENPNDLCVKCHNSDSPTFVSFNFEESWEKIKHTVPAAK